MISLMNGGGPPEDSAEVEILKRTAVEVAGDLGPHKVLDFGVALAQVRGMMARLQATFEPEVLGYALRTYDSLEELNVPQPDQNPFKIQ